MTSKLTRPEFENRLRELTKSGEPSLLGTPFAIMTLNNSPKKFYGKIVKDKFRITKNSALFPTPYLIEGKFIETDNGTIVDYKIVPIWFGYLCVRIVPIIALI